MIEKLTQCHNERPEREIIKFLKTPDGYTPDRPVHCILCRKLITKLDDQLSIKEFVISGICQKCQNISFEAD